MGAGMMFVQQSFGFQCVDDGFGDDEIRENIENLIGVDEFLLEFPEYAIGYWKDKSAQRINDVEVLASLPEELRPVYPWTKKRTERNCNHTRTHYQCWKCRRVFRNDLVQWQERGGGVVACKQCVASYGRKRYRRVGPLQEARRIAVWKYLAPICFGCAGKYPVKIMHMNHVRDKKYQVSHLVQSLAAKPTRRNASRLAAEANKCIPLCPNCHALWHHGDVVSLVIEDEFTYSADRLLEIALGVGAGDDEIID